MANGPSGFRELDELSEGDSSSEPYSEDDGDEFVMVPSDDEARAVLESPDGEMLSVPIDDLKIDNDPDIIHIEAYMEQKDPAPHFAQQADAPVVPVDGRGIAPVAPVSERKAPNPPFSTIPNDSSLPFASSSSIPSTGPAAIPSSAIPPVPPPKYNGHSGPNAQSDVRPLSMLSCFQLYFTEELMDHICQATVQQAHHRAYPPDPNFQLTTAELWVYFGILIRMSVCRLPQENDYWDTFDGDRIIQCMMSRDRFYRISRHLRFADGDDPRTDPKSPNYDPIFKIRFVSDYLQDRFRAVYHAPNSPLTKVCSHAKIACISVNLWTESRSTGDSNITP